MKASSAIYVIQICGFGRSKNKTLFMNYRKETMEIIEELFAYAVLLCNDIIITEEVYQKRLNELFTENPDHEMLLDLEWETDIQKAMIYIKTHIDHQDLSLRHDVFGRILMEKVQEYYNRCADIGTFAGKMYALWKDLPGNIQDQEPFWTLSYADDPLSWGDEEQTRRIYEEMFDHYKRNGHIK